MKYLNSSLVLLILTLGIVEDKAAIAIAPTSNQDLPIEQDSQFNNTSDRTSFQLAQNGLGRQGECRAAKREIQIYGENNIRALTGIYLNANDVVQLLENNRRGKRLIAVFDPQRNISGYVETSELKLCPPTPLAASPTTPLIVPFNTIPSTQFNTIPSTQFNTIPSTQFNTIPSTQFNTIPSTRFNTIPSTRFNTIPSTRFNTIPSTRFNTIPSTQFNTIPSALPFNTVPSVTFSPPVNQCQVVRETNLYESPGSNRGEFLEVGVNLTVDPQRTGTANNVQWIYASTPFGDSGWVIVDSVGCR